MASRKARTASATSASRRSCVMTFGSLRTNRKSGSVWAAHEATVPGPGSRRTSCCPRRRCTSRRRPAGARVERQSMTRPRPVSPHRAPDVQPHDPPFPPVTALDRSPPYTGRRRRAHGAAGRVRRHARAVRQSCVRRSHLSADPAGDRRPGRRARGPLRRRSGGARAAGRERPAAVPPGDAFYEVYAEDLAPELARLRPDLVVHEWGLPGRPWRLIGPGSRASGTGSGGCFPTASAWNFPPASPRSSADRTWTSARLRSRTRTSSPPNVGSSCDRWRSPHRPRYRRG